MRDVACGVNDSVRSEEEGEGIEGISFFHLKK